VRVDLVVLTTPVLDVDLRLLEGVKDLSVEQFVPKPTIVACPLRLYHM